MDSLKERDMADEYIYFDVESFHQFLEFIIGKLLIQNELTGCRLQPSSVVVSS